VLTFSEKGFGSTEKLHGPVYGIVNRFSIVAIASDQCNGGFQKNPLP
jgi:hypothetical protein